MKISSGLEEDGVVVGNTYDKYGSKNPLVRWIMGGFNSNLSDLVERVTPASIHEVGCGEGFWVIKWRMQGIEARGSDFSKKVVQLARENGRKQGLSSEIFKACSIYDIQCDRDDADLIVCCEVLEHLDNPLEGLSALQRVATGHVVLSVPREPIWRILNLARGKYISDLGNTPGHIQHWSMTEFVTLVSKYFEVVEVRRPLPWTMVLARSRR